MITRLRFKNWRVVGLQNYVEVFSDPILWRIFLKTVIWTVVSVTPTAGPSR